MPKFVAPIALCLFALATSGCEMLRPPVQSPEAAMNTYKGRLAEQCSSKHLENMPADKLNDLAMDFYRDVDTQVAQVIERDTRLSCGKSEGAECYNTGFIQANVQAGTINTFVKEVCSKS